MVLKFPVLVVLVGLSAGPLTSGGLTDSLIRDDRPQPQDWPRPKAEDRPQLHDWPRPKADDRPQAQEWPCPMASDIQPCVCFTDMYMRPHLDCTGVETDEQLQNALEATFPISNFLEFKIDRDPDHCCSGLTTLKPDIFGGLTFEAIIIRGTYLTSVHDQTFAQSHSTLKHLDLANNELQDFPFVTIPLYRELQSFSIENNNFLNLPRIQSTSLEVLRLSGNRNLAFDESVSLVVPSLREIYLSRINLQTLVPGIFSELENLTVIDLGENELEEVDNFAIATKGQSLASVNLNYNRIVRVRHDAVHGLISQATVTMTNNNVEELPEESWKHIFDQLVPSGSIDLAGNPLTCGCDIAWIVLEADDLYRPLITHTTKCVSGEILIFLNPSFFCLYCPGYDCIAKNL
ncbi:oplophorus-luciferin 2-monooxygenase non-catalytic subunit-like [Panulirus ornatus]|uniref:oplophorus-luciferin 2-monooxygenase non-catalytic subunit-like n=1 Tax=Panulirus ornatus TaxID=150431 RepID=UPI003A87F6A7